MAEVTLLETYQAIADDALKAVSFLLRQKRAGEIMSDAHKHLSWGEFQELERYVFERLEK